VAAGRINAAARESIPAGRGHRRAAETLIFPLYDRRMETPDALSMVVSPFGIPILEYRTCLGLFYAILGFSACRFRSAFGPSCPQSNQIFLTSSPA
jgi:hypothetical protein